MVVGAAGELAADLAAAWPDGDVAVVEESVDELDALRHASTAPNVYYFVGFVDVLPLPDASARRVVTSLAPGADAAVEIARVLRHGGDVSVYIQDRDGPALNLTERVLKESGFVHVEVAPAGDRVLLTARRA